MGRCEIVIWCCETNGAEWQGEEEGKDLDGNNGCFFVIRQRYLFFDDLTTSERLCI
jgi:hypothetical protein